MKVEIMIYVYLSVCLAMIVFNCICIIVLHRRDKKMNLGKNRFADEIRHQIEDGRIDLSHRHRLAGKLCRINNLVVFDQAVEEMYEKDSEKTMRYLEELSSIFASLGLKYGKKNRMQAAYFPYIIKKYRICDAQNREMLTDTMLKLVHEPALYCRENAMQALYTIGDEKSIVQALKILDRDGYYFHRKLISDGLLEYTGDKKVLGDMLWRKFESFSEEMKAAILDYFRFSSGEHKEHVLRVLSSENCMDEVAYSCIRYFGKYHYEPAFSYLIAFAEHSEESRWEYTAIAASALGNYPGKRTEEALKSLLSSRNWYIRYNASESVEKLGLDYTDLIDIFEGEDRYAREIMRYRLDEKKMKEREAASV